MTQSDPTPAAKIHPATREMLPDDPLHLQGVEISGDTRLMLRLLVEEYARMGWDLDAIMRLAGDPFYQGFHGLLQQYGEPALRRQVRAILARSGVMRVKTVETEPPSQRLVQIDLPPSS